MISNDPNVLALLSWDWLHSLWYLLLQSSAERKKKEFSRAEGCLQSWQCAQQWAASGSQVLTEDPEALACRNPPPSIPWPSKHPCTWLLTTKTVLRRQVLLVTCSGSRPGISVPSRKSPYPSTDFPIGFPELLPSVSLKNENAITSNTLLSSLNLSSVEWSKGRWNLESLSSSGIPSALCLWPEGQASGLQRANHVLINSFEDESIPLCLQ